MAYLLRLSFFSLVYAFQLSTIKQFYTNHVVHRAKSVSNVAPTYGLYLLLRREIKFGFCHDNFKHAYTQVNQALAVHFNAFLENREYSYFSSYHQ